MLVFLLILLGLLSVLFYYQTLSLFLLLLGYLVIVLTKLTKKELGVLLLFAGVFIIINYNFYKENEVSDSYYYEVHEVKEKYLIVSQNDNYYLLNYEDIEINRLDIIFSVANKESIKGTYNEFYNYLNKQRVYSRLDSNEFEVVKDGNNLFELVKIKLLEGRNKESVSYLNLILFNKKETFNKTLFTNFSLLSCSHLLVVSGFHLSLLFKVIDKILIKFRIEKGNLLVSSILVSIYLAMLNFSVSSFRAFLYYIFKRFNKKIDFELSNQELLGAIGVTFLFINPGYIFNYSFLYSFLFAYAVEIIVNLTKYQVKGNKGFELAFNMFLISIPIILLNSYELNVLTLIVIILISKPIGYLFIFSFITLFLSKFDLIYRLIMNVFNNLVNLIESKSVYLVFGKPSLIFLIGYFLILIFYLISKESKNKLNEYKYLICLAFLLIIQYSLPCLNSNERVTFLNVGQGDCTVLFIPRSKQAVLIDVGGSKYSDIATSKIIPYLKSKGVNVIDKVIITHDDFDHSGSLPSLISNFKVKEVINDSLVERVTIGNKKFSNLNINDKRDNDGSIVLYGEYLGLNFLFTGDISSHVEERLISEYNLEVDILKVSHHGSKNSTSEVFLREIEPSLAIISSGVNNYGHPSKEVLDRLRQNNIPYLRTDINNHIFISESIFTKFYLEYFK